MDQEDIWREIDKLRRQIHSRERAVEALENKVKDNEHEIWRLERR